MDTVILVFYVGVKGLTDSQVYRHMSDIQDAIRVKPMEGCKVLVLPTAETNEVRVECINPKLVTEEEFKKASALIEKSEKAISDFMNEFLNKEKDGNQKVV